MTYRDLIWRSGGIALLVSAAAVRWDAWSGFGSTTGLLAFGLALAGLVLLVQGRRVPAAIRIELGRHRTLPRAVRARHREKGGR